MSHIVAVSFAYTPVYLDHIIYYLAYVVNKYISVWKGPDVRMCR